MILTSSCFWSNNYELKLKVVPNSTCNWSLSNFCKKDAKNLTRNKLWWNLSKFDLFLLCKVQKKEFATSFFIEQKMLGIYGFHNKFSILGPSDLIECALDGPEPHGHEIGLSSPWEGSNWNFLVLDISFWVYAPAAKLCFNLPHCLCKQSHPTE